MIYAATVKFLLDSNLIDTTYEKLLIFSLGPVAFTHLRLSE